MGALGHGGSDLLRDPGDGDALELSHSSLPQVFQLFCLGRDHGKDFVHFLYKLRQHNPEGHAQNRTDHCVDQKDGRGTRHKALFKNLYYWVCQVRNDRRE